MRQGKYLLPPNHVNIVPAEGDLERYPFSISRRGKDTVIMNDGIARPRNKCGQFLDQFDSLHHDVRLAAPPGRCVQCSGAALNKT